MPLSYSQPSADLYGKLLWLDEILEPELGRIDPELVGHEIDHALDGVDGLGDAERAAVGDAPGRLVGVGAVDLDVGGLEVVGPRADVEQPRGELRRVGRRVGVAVVGQRLDSDRGEGAVLLARQFGGDVVVAREGVRLEVLHAVLDPLDRLPGEHGGGHGDDVARVHGDLAAEAPADIGRDDADLVLGQPDVTGHQREHGADGVRRLRGHPDREFAVDLVELGDAAARLDRGHVDARDVDVLLDRHVGFREGTIGGRPVAPLPVPDVVVLLVLLIGTQHRGPRLQRLLGVDHHGEGLVLDLHGSRAIGSGIAAGGEDAGDLLCLVHHLFDREHHLGVRHEGRHPVEVVLGEVLAGDDGEHARNGQRLRGIDLHDLGVGVGAAHDVEIQHARKLEVVDVGALAPDEAGVLLALHRVSHAAHFGRGSERHHLPPLNMGGLERAPQAPLRSGRPGEGGAPLDFTRLTRGAWRRRAGPP